MNKLTPTQQKFILHWGEMGTKWGINRTVAQIHALLYLSERPLHAEEITLLLDISRSHVSNSLKELQGWRIVKLVHVLGDKRDHFESMKDVYEMFRVVMEERKKREVDPTLSMLKECLADAEKAKESPHTVQRLKALEEFFDTTAKTYEQMSRVSTPALLKLAKLGDKIVKFIS